MQALLVFPHQLFEKQHAAASGRVMFLIEDPLLFGNDPRWPAAMHCQKLVLHRATMKAYAAEMTAAGTRVEYIDAPDGCETDSVAHLHRWIPKSVTHLHATDPVDEILLKRIRRFADERSLPLSVRRSPDFLSPHDFLEFHLASGKKPFMARFYQAQRKRMGILVDADSAPLGGKWSFDAENRSKLPRHFEPAAEPFSVPDEHVREAIDYVTRRFPESPGSSVNFRWPVTRAGALKWLDRFLDERFAEFGIYEDAIATKHATICHSAITPMLNIGLLDPADVVKRALKKAGEADIPMNSVEGFIRQIIGWREFMRGIYIHRGTEIRNRNFWRFDRPIPAAFYDGNTGIAPVDRVIRQVLADGWCHHIERLMVLGSFMLLCRIRPADVYKWFMEMFVDAYDWVMVPNVYGMSQFADGGTFTTKPYLCGSNYILKMSDEKKGPWCEVWDGLFWCFIGDHQQFFLNNHRLSMMAKTWQKMPCEKKSAHVAKSAAFLATLDG